MATPLNSHPVSFSWLGAELDPNTSRSRLLGEAESIIKLVITDPRIGGEKKMKERQAKYQTEVNQLKDRYQFDLVSLALTQSVEDQFVLKWKYAAGNLNDRYKRITLYSGKGIAGIVFKTGKSLVIENIHKEIHGKDLFNYPIVMSESLQSIGAIPLWANHRVEGVLLVGYRNDQVITAPLIEQLQNEIAAVFQPFTGREMLPCE